MSLYLCLCLSFCVSRYLCLSFSRTHIHIRSTASWARQHVRYTHIYLYMYTLSRSLSLSHTHTILIPKQRRDIARQMCDYYKFMYVYTCIYSCQPQRQQSHQRCPVGGMPMANARARWGDRLWQRIHVCRAAGARRDVWAPTCPPRRRVRGPVRFPRCTGRRPLSALMSD